MLAHPVYRGEFVWKGIVEDDFQTALTEAWKDEAGHLVFPRPQLRLVTDEIWSFCNQRPGSRFHRGGRRHLLAGVISCAECRARLSICGGTTEAPQVYCAQCYARVRVGAADGWTGYVSAKAAQAAITVAIERLLTPEVVREFKKLLKRQLCGDVERTVEKTRMMVKSLTARCERLAKMIGSADEEDPFIREQYADVRGQLRVMKQKEQELQRTLTPAAKKEIEEQLAFADASKEIQRWFEIPTGDPGEWQAFLRRAFTSIVLESRRRGHALFRFEYAPGALVAELTSTGIHLDAAEQSVTMRLAVDYDRARKRFEVTES
jgi:hypothetical protein